MQKKISIHNSKLISWSTICTLLYLCTYSIAFAQAPRVDTFAFYIAPNGSFYVNNNAQITINTNVINSGTFGTVQGSTVTMLGDKWRNTATATFPDEWGVNNPNAFSGVGGVFRFGNPNFPQMVAGGFSVANKSGSGSFPNLVVANPRGVYLDENTDTHIRGTLQFVNGLLWLNDNNLQIGINNPGSIIGYSDTRFIATGNTPRGGFLYRSKVSSASGSVVFPIGPQAGSYSPVSVMFNTASAQDLHIRAFDNIFSNAFQGTTGSSASVQQTWNIGQENTTSVPSIVALQHTNSREGAGFTTHRGNSYVSLYDFTLRTWDTVGPSGFITPGTYTTSTPQSGTYINARSFATLGTNTYLTKTADTRTDSITLAKAVTTPLREADGSYRVTFIFLVRNTSTLPANTLQVLDTLSSVFTSPASFSVSSVTASGRLVANVGYDGVTNTDLLLPASTLASRRTDTVTLVVNVIPNKKDGYYYNSASLKGLLNGFSNTQYEFNNRSVNGFTPPAPAAAPVPTPVILSASPFQMPEGFSPNNDGVNDRFIIGSLGLNQAAIWVFNKQGYLVYRNNNYKNDWDGTNNQGGPTSNQKVEDGTYYYKVVVTITATGKQESYYGFLSIWK